MKLRPELTIGLFVLLVASAGLALWVERSPEGVPGAVKVAAPWVFFVFALGFAGYRLGLVAAGRYSAFKAFFQVLIAAVCFMLLLPVQWGQIAPVVPSVPGVTSAGLSGPGPSGSGSAAGAPLASLLVDSSPEVRAAAAELAGWRKDVVSGPSLVKLLDDPSGLVRDEAHRSLVLLNQNQDLGPAGDPSATSKWRERFP